MNLARPSSYVAFGVSQLLWTFASRTALSMYSLIRSTHPASGVRPGSNQRPGSDLVPDLV